MIKLTLEKNMDYQDYDIRVAYVGGTFKVTDFASGSTVNMSDAKPGETYEFTRKFDKLHYAKVAS